METFIYTYGGLLILVSLLIAAFLYPKFALYLLPFAFSLSPEIVVGETAKRLITVRLEDLLLSVMLIKIAFDYITKTYFPPENVKNNIFFGSMGLYSFSLILATTLGVAFLWVSPAAGFFFTLKLIQFFLFFFVIFYFINSEKDVRALIAGAAITMAIVTFIGYTQLPTEPRTAMPFEGETPEPNTLGGYYVIIGAVIGGLYIHETRYRRKILYGLLLALSVIPFLYTMSRSSWIAAWVTFMTFLMITKGFQRKIIFLGLSVLIIMSLPLMPGAIKERAQFWKAEEGFEGTQAIGRTKFDPSTSERLGQYARLPKLFVTSPIFGRGLTGAGFFDGQYIRVIVETGLLGLSAFVYLIYKILGYSYTIYKTTALPTRKGLALGLFCGTIGILAHSIGASTFMIVRIMEPYMLFLALLTVYNKFAEQGAIKPAYAYKAYLYPYLITNHSVK